MNPLRLEIKRILFSVWMLPTMLMISVGLAYMTYRIGVYPQQKDSLVCLSLLLGNVEYHIFLYAVLAMALVGVDISADIPLLEILAGNTLLHFHWRKVILYAIAVLVCELLYLTLPLFLWGISLSPLWRMLPTRLFLYLGIAMPFFTLQAVLPNPQTMLIGDTTAAILWIGFFDDDLNAWHSAVLGIRALPAQWFVLATLSIVISILVSLKLLTNKRRLQIK